MNDEILPADVLDSAHALLRASRAFLDEALSYAPMEILVELQNCSELVLSVRHAPAPALCISGRNGERLVKWDIELQARPSDVN